MTFFASPYLPVVVVVIVLFLMTGLGLVGFADDFIKLFMRRSLGLRSGAKLSGQAIVGGIFAPCSFIMSAVRATRICALPAEK